MDIILLGAIVISWFLYVHIIIPIVIIGILLHIYTFNKVAP